MYSRHSDNNVIPTRLACQAGTALPIHAPPPLRDRDASIKYVMGLGAVDAITIGYKSPAEIDEAIERTNTHLNA